MPLLNTANKIYAGSSVASAAYLGATKVWPKTAMVNYSLFTPVDHPANNGSPTGAVVAGIAFFITAPGVNAIALKWYQHPSETSPTLTLTLWDAVTQANMGQVAVPKAAAEGWIQGSLSSHVPLTPNHTYYVTGFSPAGYYNYTTGYFASAARVSGPITAYKDGTVPTTSGGTTGVYVFNSTNAFPTNSFGANYWADVVVESPT